MNFDTLFGPYQDKVYINYDWTDVDSATGYVVYDGMTTEDDEGHKYDLKKSSERNDLFTDSTNPGNGVPGVYYTTYTKVTDLDFDTTTFQKARTIRGTGYIKAFVVLTGDEASMSACCYLVFRIRKYDGSTETEIASEQSRTDVFGEGANNEMFCVDITIPETTINVGEKLRLTVEVWLKGNNGGGSTWKCHANLYWNVRNDTDDNTNQRLISIVPFKIEAET
jgi:hypothetical protein